MSWVSSSPQLSLWGKGQTSVGTRPWCWLDPAISLTHTQSRTISLAIELWSWALAARLFMISG